MGFWGIVSDIIYRDIFYKKYISLNRNVFSIQTKLGNVSSLQNEEILNDEKFSLGGRWLRGFDNYGVGPRNSRTSYTGGNNLVVTKLAPKTPKVINSMPITAPVLTLYNFNNIGSTTTEAKPIPIPKQTPKKPTPRLW